MKLNLGCGHRKLDGFVNVDRWAGCEPDVVLDLEAPGDWPEPGAVEEVRAIHVVEHIWNLNGLMQWLYRVMAPGALLHVTVPHHLSEGFWGDPTHARPITLATLTLYSRERCREFRERGWPNTPLADVLGVDFELVSVSVELQGHIQGLPGDVVDRLLRDQVNVANEVRFVLRRV